MLHSKPLSHKTNDLPVGITQTWRQREGKSPYLELQVAYVNSKGKCKTKHIYVGVNPTRKKFKEAFLRAKNIRAQYVTLREKNIDFKEL